MDNKKILDDEYYKLKEHVKKRCELIIKYCEGAQMCSDTHKPLYEFATSMICEMRRLSAETFNFCYIPILDDEADD